MKDKRWKIREDYERIVESITYRSENLEEIEKHGYTMENFFTKNPRKALYLLVSSLDKWCTFRGIKHDYLANVNDPSTLRLAFIDYLLTGERKFGEIYGEYPLLDALCAYAFNLSSYSIPDGTFLFKNKQSSFQMIDVQEELRTARTELIKLSKEDESDTLYDMFAPEEKKKKYSAVTVSALIIGAVLFGHAYESAPIRSIYPFGNIWGVYIFFLSGVSMTVLLFFIFKAISDRLNCKWLSDIGKNTMSVYSWHMIFLTLFGVAAVKLFGIPVEMDIFNMAFISREYPWVRVLVAALSIIACMIPAYIKQYKKKNN